MDWFVFCPIRGLYFTCPDDTKGEMKVVTACRELAADIKKEGFKMRDIIVIRGERKKCVEPIGDYQLITVKPR